MSLIVAGTSIHVTKGCYVGPTSKTLGHIYDHNITHVSQCLECVHSC